MAKSKLCPICKATHFALDIVDGFTGWTFCANCYQSARQSDMFKKILRAIMEAREHHRESIIVEVRK